MTNKKLNRFCRIEFFQFNQKTQLQKFFHNLICKITQILKKIKTKINVIGGLDNFSSGEILIKGKSTKDFSKSDYDSYRNTYIGFVFQEYNLLDNMTMTLRRVVFPEPLLPVMNTKPLSSKYKSTSFNAATSLLFVLYLQGIKDDKQKIEQILQKVDLQDILSRRPR